MSYFRDQPIFIVFMWIAVAAMSVPMFLALRLEDWLSARTFLYNGLFFGILTALISIATHQRRFHSTAGEYLLTILAAFILLPIILAAPLNYLMPNLGFAQSYFEMVSSLTTTGATLFDNPESVSPVLHLWRGLVAWLGGLMILIVALSIFQPLEIGGFEVFSVIKAASRAKVDAGRADFHHILWQNTLAVSPIYIGLTSVLALALMMSGDRALVAVIHAMSTVSTSGISPLNNPEMATSARMGEVIIFLGLIFAVSRHTTSFDTASNAVSNIKADKEFNLMLICVIGIPFALFFRHYVAAFDVSSQNEIMAAIQTFWGGIYTTLSFLTTMGFESGDWETAQLWSGLNTPGLLLMGLVMLGGGIATTAGGVKLLRVYALYKHGLREMQRLSFPHSVAGSGAKARSIRRQGAYVAWVFLMLYFVSIGVIMILLSLTGLQFEESLVFAISGLSTTGPLVDAVSDIELGFNDLSNTARYILCAAMILGRLEALAVLAILNPAYWRN